MSVIITFTPNINLFFDIKNTLVLGFTAIDGSDAIKQFVHFGVQESVHEAHLIRIFLLRIVKFIKKSLPCSLPKYGISDLDHKLLNDNEFIEAIMRITKNMDDNKISGNSYKTDDPLIPTHFEQFEKDYFLVLVRAVEAKVVVKWFNIGTLKIIG